MENLGTPPEYTNKSSHLGDSSSVRSKRPSVGKKEEAISDIAAQRLPQGRVDFDFDDSSRISTRRYRRTGSTGKEEERNLKIFNKAESEMTTHHPNGSLTIVGFGGHLTPGDLERKAIYARNRIFAEPKASTPNPPKKNTFAIREKSSSLKVQKEEKPEQILQDIKEEIRNIGSFHYGLSFQNLQELQQKVNYCKSKGDLEKYLNKAFKLLSKKVVKALGSKVAKCAKKRDLNSIGNLNDYFAENEEYAKWAIKQIVKNKVEQERIIDLVVITSEKKEQKGKQYEKIFNSYREICDYIRNKGKSNVKDNLKFSNVEDDLKFVDNVHNLIRIMNSYLTENIAVFAGDESQQIRKNVILGMQNELVKNLKNLLNTDDLSKNLEIKFDYDKKRDVIAEKKSI